MENYTEPIFLCLLKDLMEFVNFICLIRIKVENLYDGLINLALGKIIPIKFFEKESFTAFIFSNNQFHFLDKVCNLNKLLRVNSDHILLS